MFWWGGRAEKGAVFFTLQFKYLVESKTVCDHKTINFLSVSFVLLQPKLTNFKAFSARFRTPGFFLSSASLRSASGKKIQYFDGGSAPKNGQFFLTLAFKTWSNKNNCGAILIYPKIFSAILHYPKLSSTILNNLNYPQLSWANLDYPELSSTILSYPQLTKPNPKG